MSKLTTVLEKKSITSIIDNKEGFIPFPRHNRMQRWACGYAGMMIQEIIYDKLISFGKQFGFFTVSELCNISRLTENTVRKALKKCEEVGLFLIHSFANKGKLILINNSENQNFYEKILSNKVIFNLKNSLTLEIIDTENNNLSMNLYSNSHENLRVNTAKISGTIPQGLAGYPLKVLRDTPSRSCGIPPQGSEVYNIPESLDIKESQLPLKNIYKNIYKESNQNQREKETMNVLLDTQIVNESEQRKFDDDEIKKDLENIKNQTLQTEVLEVPKLDVIDYDKKISLKDKEEISTASPSASLPTETKIENQDEIKIKLLAERISEELEGMTYNLALSLVKAHQHDFVLFTYEKFLGLLEIDESGNSKIKNQVAYFRKMLSNLDSKKDFEENLKSVNFEERKAIEKDEFSRYSELAKYLKLATSINKNLIYDDIAKQILNSCYSAFFDERDYFKGFGEKRVSYKINTYENQRDFVVKLIKIKELIGFEDLEKVFNKFMVSSGKQYATTYAQNKVVSKIKDLWERI